MRECGELALYLRAHTHTFTGAIVVDPMLVRWLRPHQREGVAFMFDCVAGLRLPEGRGGHMCLCLWVCACAVPVRKCASVHISVCMCVCVCGVCVCVCVLVLCQQVRVP